MITHFRHAGIVVADLEHTLSFWRDTLGFRVVRQMEESGPFISALLGLPDVRVTTTKLSAPDGSIIELLYFHSHPGISSWSGNVYSTGLTHLAFTVDDINSEYERLKINGVSFMASPQISPDGNAKVVYAVGPENLLLEFVEVLES